MNYSVAMMTLDAAKIWGENDPSISAMKIEMATSSGVYGATFGCGVGSIALAFGRSKVMLIFSCIAILGLIIQSMSFDSIDGIIVGRLMYGFSAGILFCMAPKIIQENTI